MSSSFEWGESLPSLSGDRVRLRALHDEDAPALLAIFGDAAVMQFWSSPPLENLSAAQDLLEEIRSGFETRRLFQWGVALIDTNLVIGTCTLYQMDLRNRRCELGFAMQSSCWGKGLATEAVTLAIRFAFDVLDLHRLEADVDPDNIRSLRLLERLGFVREGYLRERWHHLGQLRDTVFLGLLRAEWRGRAKP